MQKNEAKKESKVKIKERNKHVKIGVITQGTLY